MNKILRISIVMYLFSSLFYLNGCGGINRIALSAKNNNLYFEEDNFSALGPWNGPERAANAYVMMKKADMDELIMKAYYQKGEVAEKTTKYVFVAINTTPKPAYVLDPERGDLLPLSSNNGYQFLYLSELPEKLIFKGQNNRVIWQPRPDQKKMENKRIFRGRIVDVILYLTNQ